MPYLTVCSLARIDQTVRQHAPSHMLTVISGETEVARPAAISANNHLRLDFNDIGAEAPGMVAPGEHHVQQIIAFARDWDRQAPMLIHCFAGVSRSTASAYLIALALRPELNEHELARDLRLRSPTATPNARMIALADDALEREGMMVDAIAQIGRGAYCFEGAPFVLPLSDDDAGLF